MADLAEILCNKTIMVVEDEALIAAYVADLLGDLGCSSVISLYDIASAVDELKTQTPDLALLDLQLGDALSYPVAKMLADRKVPFIFTTGHDAEELEKPWDSQPCLLKPYTTEDLATALTQAFGNTAPSS